LERVDDSSDNSTVAVLGERVCTAIGCAQMERYQTTVHIAGRADVVLPGDPVLSRNGRYVLLSSSIRPDFISNRSGIVTVLLVDLATGKQTPYQAWAFGSPVAQQVADDGTVLLSTPSGLALGRDGQLTTLGIGSSYGLINSAGTSILYSPYYGDSPLYAYTIAGGASTLLAETFAGFSFVIASDDGSAIAYAVSAPPNTWQIWSVRSDGSGRRQLTSFPEGASPVAISGNGKIVFARTGNDATGNNRTVRIDVASGQQTEIVPAMPGPFYSSIVLQTVRGGLAQFGWLGLHLTTSAAPQPLPVSLGGPHGSHRRCSRSHRLGGGRRPVLVSGGWKGAAGSSRHVDIAGGIDCQFRSEIVVRASEVGGEEDVSVGVRLFQEGVVARARQEGPRGRDTTAAPGLGLRGSRGRRDLTG
jgi:hypothetical protein